MRILASGSLLPILTVLAAGVPSTAVGEEIVLSRENCRGFFLVPLTWSPRDGERHEMLAAFHTGADEPAIIDPDVLERGPGWRLREGKRFWMRGVEAGEVWLNSLAPRTQDLDHLSRALGRNVDMLLPFSTFDDFLLTLDYPRGELRISRDTLPEPDGVEILSADGPDRRPWLRLEIGGRERVMLIASGKDGGFYVRPNEGLSWLTPPRPVQLVQGRRGTAKRRTGRLDEVVAVGPLTVRQPLASPTEKTEAIGAQVLAPLVLSFDQKHRRIRLRAPETDTLRMRPYRGTGALVIQREGWLEVLEIVAGSPAESAGVRVGDRVIAIDGIDVYEHDCSPIAQPPPELDEKRCTIQRGQQTLEIKVPLVDLVP